MIENTSRSDTAEKPDGRRLIYLMGASGAGKDTLLKELHASLDHDDGIVIAHRYITRPSSAHEASVALTEAEFIRRRGLGCFALHWQSHDLHYGVGVEIDAWLHAGLVVMVNGSRAHLMKAHQRYPRLCAVQVCVDKEVLRCRLLERGREPPWAIAARLERADRDFPVPGDLRLTQLDNSGAIQDAASRLLQLARSLR